MLAAYCMRMHRKRRGRELETATRAEVVLGCCADPEAQVRNRECDTLDVGSGHGAS